MTLITLTSVIIIKVSTTIKLNLLPLPKKILLKLIQLLNETYDLYLSNYFKVTAPSFKPLLLKLVLLLILNYYLLVRSLF